MKKSTFLSVAAAAGVILLAGSAWLLLSDRSSDVSVASKIDMPRYRAGGLEVGITTVPATPRVGENRLIVELEYPGGKPVTEVAIDAHAEMPAMGAMPAMRAPVDFEEVAPGRYEGSVDLPMRGEWPLTLNFETPEGQPVRLQFGLATDRAEMPIAAGGTPIGEANGDSATITEDSGMPRYRAGDLEIAVDIDPRTARVGDNKIMIEVTDAEGHPIEGIEVDAFAEMPAMGAMPAMRAPADLQQTSPGQYEGSVNLSMRGEWPLTVEISHPELGNRRLQFDLATDRQGLSIAAGATPVGGAAMPAQGAGAITINNRRRQMIGLETGKAEQRDLVKRIRAVGEVTYDERLLSHVTLKFDGYIGDLKADYVGTPVEKGQVLFTVYSPELLAAQQEYLEILKRRGSSDTDDPLIQAARQRLALWDMSAADIEALERRGTPEDYVAIHAPRSGTLLERNIADGGAAQMGQRLLTIADLSRVWIEAEVFEADLELVRPGMTATISLPYLPGRSYPATIDYVYPYLQADSRTGRIRLSLDNPDGELKPNMYAEVSLEADLGRTLSVPEEAILVAGDSRVVFVDLGQGRLQPVRIKAGRNAQGFVEVLDGLAPGDTVVTSGNFLIAAEARLKTGIDQW